MSTDQRNRQSYGVDTLEDDPFVEAHRDAMKKKKPDPSVNYGYASQGMYLGYFFKHFISLLYLGAGLLSGIENKGCEYLLLFLCIRGLSNSA